MAEAIFSIPIPQGKMHLIQKQKEYIDELFHKGIISDYSVSQDKKTVWVTFAGKTVKEAALLMEDFPLAGFMEYHFIPTEVQ